MSRDADSSPLPRTPVKPSASAPASISSTSASVSSGSNLPLRKYISCGVGSTERAAIERTAGVDAGAGERAQQLVTLVGVGDVHTALPARQALGEERDDGRGFLVAVVVRQAEMVAVAEAAEVAREVFDHGDP